MEYILMIIGLAVSLYLYLDTMNKYNNTDDV